MIILVLPDIAEEDELLVRARKRDKAAMETIYERYFSAVYSFIRLRVNDRATADDLASDVFVRLMRAFHNGTAPRHSLRGWLFRVTRNVLYDHNGKRQSYTNEALDEWVADKATDVDPEIRAIQNLRSQEVKNAIRRLPLDQQEVLVLRFAQSLSLEETADLMGKNVNTIKSLQFRAVNTLRQHLKEG
jgi:RNA polymerase sigma-70 factor (ECF subfamily)